MFKEIVVLLSIVSCGSNLRQEKSILLSDGEFVSTYNLDALRQTIKDEQSFEICASHDIKYRSVSQSYGIPMPPGTKIGFYDFEFNGKIIESREFIINADGSRNDMKDLEIHLYDKKMNLNIFEGGLRTQIYDAKMTVTKKSTFQTIVSDHLVSCWYSELLVP